MHLINTISSVRLKLLSKDKFLFVLELRKHFFVTKCKVMSFTVSNNQPNIYYNNAILKYILFRYNTNFLKYLLQSRDYTVTGAFAVSSTSLYVNHLDGILTCWQFYITLCESSGWYSYVLAVLHHFMWIIWMVFLPAGSSTIWMVFSPAGSSTSLYVNHLDGILTCCQFYIAISRLCSSFLSENKP